MWIADIEKGLEISRASGYEVSHVSFSFKFRPLWSPQRKYSSSSILQHISNVVTRISRPLQAVNQKSGQVLQQHDPAHRQAKSGYKEFLRNITRLICIRFNPNNGVTSYCYIWGSRSGAADDSSLLGWYALSSDIFRTSSLSKNARPWRGRHYDLSKRL